MKKFVLGISGSIGSGKTTAGRYFEQKGATFIDADRVVNDLYKPGKDGYLKIVNYFGKKFVTTSGEINRKKLARFVFGDPHKLKILHFLIHPLVTSEVQKLIDKAPTDFIVLEATYFEDKYLGRLVSKIAWIECENSILQERVLARPGITGELYKQILKTQSKPKKIDFVLMNNTSEEDFYKQLDELALKI